MLAVLRRELSAYFSSAIGYVYLAVFYIFSGYFFFAGSLAYGLAELTGVFSSIFTLVMFLIPILTMRLMSEDKKQKTDQLLLTSPVSLLSLVMGKFLAAFLVFAMGVAVTLLYGFVLALFVTVVWAVIIGNVLGLLLLGAALISIGMFLSSLTENQVIAAVAGFVVMMLLMLVDMLAAAIPFSFLSDLLYSLSFSQRYAMFTYGILNFANVIFFLSFAAVFVYLTVRVIEKRRWS